MCSEYAEIAFRSYLNVKQRYQFYKGCDFNVDIFRELGLINQKAIVAVVFAQMSIESFLNDYAAACLGDNEFYDNFDKLDVISKLQLIVKFILHKKLDKSREPFTSLKTLNKQRNNYIHNKSYYLDLSQSNFQDIDIETYAGIAYAEELKSLKEILKEAKTAMKTITEIIKFFEERDDNIHAVHRFFAFGVDPIDLDISEIKQELNNLGLNYEIQI